MKSFNITDKANNNGGTFHQTNTATIQNQILCL